VGQIARPGNEFCVSGAGDYAARFELRLGFVGV